ncbi:MAG: YhfC family intramembrane metalloprotease [Sulfolobales archaeon]|nr:YhfC family intramembrane metalloprotease [Sulfolobales archaeon]MCX8199703.1 YhfC family intramembrane metalloprotease [Sulfolobales archaeon]MDW8170657.1 YhfC family glutamic-type intramembrane protease [Desulfurococcaceae archaeon]
MSTIIPIAIALAPALIALAKVAGTKGINWVIAILGGSGWFLALILRIPILMAVPLPEVIYGYFASLMAGLFEETTRFLFLRIELVRSASIRRSIALGLGWGFIEALLIYAIPVSLAVYQYSWIDLLPGALERNSAILIHLSLTLLLSRNPWSFKLLTASIIIHSAANITAITALYLLRNAWLVELVIAAFSALIFTTIAIPILRDLRSAVNKPVGERYG